MKVGVNTTFYSFITLNKGSTSSNALVQLNDCVCLGHKVTYECTVCGNGATVWTGSLFDSSCSDIILRHRNFHPGSTSRICNNKTANATGVTIINGSWCFTSQLRFVINQDHINNTITCLHEYSVNDSATQSILDEISVTVTKGTLCTHASLLGASYSI